MLGWEMRDSIEKSHLTCEIILHYTTEDIPRLMGQDGTVYDVESMASRLIEGLCSRDANELREYKMETVLLGDRYTLFGVMVYGIDTYEKTVTLKYDYYFDLKVKITPTTFTTVQISNNTGYSKI